MRSPRKSLMSWMPPAQFPVKAWFIRALRRHRACSIAHCGNAPGRRKKAVERRLATSYGSAS